MGESGVDSPCRQQGGEMAVCPVSIRCFLQATPYIANENDEGTGGGVGVVGGEGDEWRGE